MVTIKEHMPSFKPIIFALSIIIFYFGFGTSLGYCKETLKNVIEISRVEFEKLN